MFALLSSGIFTRHDCAAVGAVMLTCIVPTIALAQGGNANGIGIAMESQLNEANSSPRPGENGGSPSGYPGSYPGGASSGSNAPGSSSSGYPGSSSGGDSGSSSGSYPGSSNGSYPGSSSGYPGASSGGDSGSSSGGYPGSSSGYPGGSETGGMSGYPGSSSGGYPGSPGQAPAASAFGGADFGFSIASMFSGGMGAGAAPKTPQLTLADHAALAYFAGDQRQAESLIYAHMLAGGEAAADDRKQIKLSRLLKRPVWNVRFGISINPRLPDTMEGPIEPIREDSTAGGASASAYSGGASAGYSGPPGSGDPRGGAGRNGGSPQPGGGPGSGSSSSGSSSSGSSSSGSPGGGYPGSGSSSSGSPGGDYPGSGSPSFGSPPGGSSSGSMGDDSEMEQRMRGMSAGGYGGANAAPVAMTLGGDGAIQAQAALDANLGLVAEFLQIEFAKRQSAGAFGTIFNGMETSGIKLAQTSGGSSSVVSMGLPMWIPGVDFVGEGNQTEMLKLAKANGVELLMHFDIIVKENRIATASTYATRCKLLLVDTGETVGTSKLIDKNEVTGKKKTVRELVAEQLTNLFEIIDKKVTLEPMPTLKPEQAISRIDSLLSGSKPASLRNLAEMSVYCDRNYITAEQFDSVVFFAGGDETLMLLHEDPTERINKSMALVAEQLR